MNRKLKTKILEALSSVVPITLIVLFLSFTVAPMPVGSLILFLFGAILLVLGVGLFSLGVDLAMLPIGEGIGGQIAGSRKLWGMIPVCFVIGVFVTIAEPDLQVLARQVPAVPDIVIILTVAAGVGFFLVMALLRAKFGWPLNRMLILCYAIVFGMAFLVPREFLAVAFDSGGVTTGPVTVPFIMALGGGLAALRQDHDSDADSFGVVALCSIGPILAVMILGLCYNSSDLSYTPFSIPDLETTADVGLYFASGFPTYIEEVALGLAPIIVFFTVFQIIALHLRRRQVIKIVVGMVYTYVGLVLFLTGVNVGFMPAGYYLGEQIAEVPFHWILVLIGMVVGWFIVAAEPAVHVLNEQVEEITGGAISQKAMGTTLSVGMAAAVGLAMLRVVTGVSVLYFLVPGYLIALILSFFVPKVFTAIAFDSGGVASGPMTATFLLPFAMGACEALGGNILTDAFGIVAMVAMTPLVAIQILGLVYQRKSAREQAGGVVGVLDEDFIISYDDLDDEYSMEESV